MSGDGIFGRLPYHILTKVIHLVGWKRMELNRRVRFTGVTDRIFHSNFRRCLIIRMQGRFVDPAYYSKHMLGSAKYGVFPRQPDLKAFF